jgi:hypothetical protein
VFDGSSCHPIPVGRPVLSATVTGAEPVVEPDAAEIINVPAAIPLTRPVAFTVARLVFDDDHWAEAVRSFVPPPLLSVPVAVNCTGAPRTTSALEGASAIEITLGGATVRTVEVFIDPEAAPMLLFPCAALVAIPELLIVATAVFEDVQVAELVRSFLLPSLNVPSAVNCWFCPATIEGPLGVIVSDDKLGGSIAPLDPPPPPHPLVTSNPVTKKVHATITRNRLPWPIPDLYLTSSLPAVSVCAAAPTAMNGPKVLSPGTYVMTVLVL